jgi:hypothetical protein
MDPTKEQPGRPEAPLNVSNAPSAEPVPPALTSIEQAQKDRTALAQELGSPTAAPIAPPAGNEAPPAVQTGAQQGAQPAPSQPSSAPESKPAEGKKETPAEFQKKLQKEASSLGLFELMGKAMESLAGMLENLKDWDPMKILGLGSGTPEKKKSTGEKYTEEQLKQMALDLAKNKDRVYPAQDKAVEDVATVLNLPIRETAQKFLDSLTDSGMVFETSMDKMPELEPGDVLFFKKNDDKGEAFAYTCAVVTNKEPLKMRIVPEGGGTPQEIDVKESDYFKNSWYGFVKTKKNV